MREKLAHFIKVRLNSLMQAKTKSFLKRMLLIDLIALLILLGLGMLLIVPDCTFDCEARGQAFGAGAANLIIFCDLVAILWFWLKRRK